jgi:hypothetical protein
VGGAEARGLRAVARAAGEEGAVRVVNRCVTSRGTWAPG